MPIAVAFWILLGLWLVLGAFSRWSPAPSPWPPWLPDLFPFLALALLGWQTFGPALK